MSSKAATVRTRRKGAEAKAAFRDEVVAIARQLFAEEGYASVSLRTIAARAGCTPMALYRYFPNKHALLRFIWSDIFQELFAISEAAMEAARTPRTKLRAYWTSWIDYWLQHPDSYRVVFMNQDEGVAVPTPDLPGMEQPFFASGELARSHLQKLADVFVAGMQRGEFRRMPPELCVQILSSQILGLAHGLITVPEFNWSALETLRAATMEASIRGFLADVKS